MKNSKFIGEKWEDYKKIIEFSDEEKEIMDLEFEIISAVIEARKKKNLSQRDLSALTNIKQPSIVKIEKGKNSPQINTLLKILSPLGYTLKVVPKTKI